MKFKIIENSAPLRTAPLVIQKVLNYSNKINFSLMLMTTTGGSNFEVAGS